MKEEGIEQLTDWRGAPINIGDSVIYAAGSGSSRTLVEAEVIGFTPQAARLRVIRENGGYRDGKDVTVAADRLTVVEKLPKATVPTLKEAKRAQRENYLARLTEAVALREAGEPTGSAWWDARPVEWFRERVAELEKELSTDEH